MTTFFPLPRVLQTAKRATLSRKWERGCSAPSAHPVSPRTLAGEGAGERGIVCLRRIVVGLCLILGIAPVYAQDAEITICFNYGCLSQEKVWIEAARLDSVLQPLKGATDAEDERRRLAVAIGALYAIAAEQTPVGNDRGGNYDDDGVFGRMDCIDHSTTTTRFLKLLEARGGLRWHRVLEPARRLRFLVMQHFSAAIELVSEETTLEGAAPENLEGTPPEKPEAAPLPNLPAPRYVVDSWFVDNGKPAVIMSLENWLNGEDPTPEHF